MSLKSVLRKVKDNPIGLYIWNEHRRIKGKSSKKKYNDFVFINKVYLRVTGRNINWNNPQRFTEKLQWLKLFYRNPEMPIVSDKVDVRAFLMQKGYGNLLNEVYGIYDDVDEINFANLPERFVLKVASGSGWNLVCKNKKEISWGLWKKVIKSWQKQDLAWYGREWNYSGLKSRIIIEKYLEDESGELRDYKFFAFNGKVEYVRVDLGRFTTHYQNYYDCEWNFKEFRTSYPNYMDEKIDKPKNFEEMLAIANKLAEGFPHVRVDLYNVNGKIYFGELTFFISSGFLSFYPDEYDFSWGEMLKLPEPNFNLELLERTKND